MCDEVQWSLFGVSLAGWNLLASLAMAGVLRDARRGVAEAARMTGARPAYLPGDRAPVDDIARMIRVDQAGEYGATRIYAGQLAMIRRSRAAGAIREMAEQERRHLAQFDRLLSERRVRPTALSPLWHVAGYALGAATALFSERTAMACTVAVEEVIDDHYARPGRAARRTATRN